MIFEKESFYLDAYWTTIQYIHDWPILAQEKVKETAQKGFLVFSHKSNTITDSFSASS